MSLAGSYVPVSYREYLLSGHGEDYSVEHIFGVRSTVLVVLHSSKKETLSNEASQTM
jgi:hypothetical protein